MNEIHNKIISYFKNKENPVILDVGAYLLEDSIIFGNLFPKGRIYSFECDPRNINVLQQLEYPMNIYLEHFAIGNVDGEVDFYQSKDIDFSRAWQLSGSIHKPTGHLEEYTVRFETAPIKVEGMKLDTWYQTAGIDKIELLWVDVNGGEGDFLLGAEEVLKKTHLLWIETFDKQMYENQVNTAWVLEKLQDWEILWREGHNVLVRNNNNIVVYES